MAEGNASRGSIGGGKGEDGWEDGRMRKGQKIHDDGSGLGPWAVGHYTTRHRTSTVGPHFRRRRMRKEEEKSLAVPIHPRPGIPAARLLAFTRTTWGYTREQVFGVLLTLSTVLVVAWGRLGKLIIKKLFWKAPPSPAVGTKIRILLRIPRKFLY